jgi:hypothetical protein
MNKSGNNRGGPGKMRPNAWKVGPDPVKYAKYRVWIQQKNQAQFRDEGWDLDLDTWIYLWGELWHNRGRAKDDYCMTRLDFNKPWTADNVEVITRQEHLTRHRAKQIESRRENARIVREYKKNNGII